MSAINNNLLEIKPCLHRDDINNRKIRGDQSEKITKMTKRVTELCKQFYELGWLPGSGGGMAIQEDGLVYCTPSGVEKEWLVPEDVIVMKDPETRVNGRSLLKCSDCLCLFMLTFELRNAGCCIHSHSISANLITVSSIQCCRGTSGNNVIGEFRIKNQEMLKAIKKGSTSESLLNTDTLVVPIIRNGLRESDLSESMRKCLIDYPQTNAVLVENHGVFVWGRTWKEAKLMAESYDYLFNLKLEASKYRLDDRLA